MGPKLKVPGGTECETFRSVQQQAQLPRLAWKMTNRSPCALLRITYAVLDELSLQTARSNLFDKQTTLINMA